MNHLHLHLGHLIDTWLVLFLDKIFCTSKYNIQLKQQKYSNSFNLTDLTNKMGKMDSSQWKLPEVNLSTLIFLLFTKKILKFLDFSELLVADTPMNFVFEFLKFLGPPYNQKEEKWKFHIWSVGYQNRVKGWLELISKGIFGKYSKIKILIMKFWTRSNFEAFFRPSTFKSEKSNGGEGW